MDIDRVADATGASIARAYRAGEADPVAVTECLLDRIEKAKADHIFINVTAERALAEAKAAARRYKENAPLSPLDGVPIAWKDLVDIAGTPTTAGSGYFRQGPIKAQDQICVANAVAAGMVTMGKLNLSELAYSALGLNPHFGTPRNPHGRSLHSPGGSSSGSGAAVAARLVPCAIGTDTGGSVRIPAAFNGVTGHKTSFGRLDSAGMVPLGRSYDTLGPLARAVEDCILLDQILRGGAATQVPRVDLRAVTIVVPSNVVAKEAEDAVTTNFERTIAALARAGVAIRRENLDVFDEIFDITERHGTLTAAEAYHEYRGIIESDRVSELDRRIVHRICAGKTMSADDLLTILRARWRLIPKLIQLLDGAYLAMPTTPITAPEIAPLEASDDMFHSTNTLASRNTMPVNFLDLCAVALPNGSSEAGLPTSFQLVARHGEDEKLLAVGREVEQVILAAM